MKNGLLAWNGVLTVIAGYLLILHFTARKPKPDPKTVSPASPGMNKSFRIAYFEMDSVEANFSMVKDVKAELSRKEDAINSELDRMSKNLQLKYNYFQNQAQTGTMTQPQSEAASQELKTLDDQMKNRKQSLDQEYGDLVSRRMKDVKSKIEEFLREYNKASDYSYIVSYEQGLFYYKDTAYNITPDVIRGLNELYKPKKN